MKVTAPRIQIYEPVGNDYVKSTDEHPLAEEVSPGINHQFIDDLALRNEFLRGNPFFYNSLNASVKVHSVEDYLIKYKRREIAFGDVIHNEDVRFFMKKRIVKKHFKIWHKGFMKEQKVVTKKNMNIVEVIGGIEYLGIKWLYKLLMMFGFVLLLIIMNPKSQLMNLFASRKFGRTIQNSIINSFTSTSWIQIVGNISLYMLLVLILYSSIHNSILKDYTKSYGFAKNTLERSKNQIRKDHKKKYKSVRKYYIKNINKKKILFPPFKIEDIQQGKVNFEYFEDVTTKIVDRANKLKKTRWIYISTKTLLTVLSLAGGTTVLVFILYKTVSGLLF